MLPKTSTSVKSYDGKTKWIYCFIKDVELLETYNDIWNNVSYSIKKELDFEPIHNNEFLKTEIRSYGHEATDFHDNEIPKVDFTSIILIDFVLKKGENYYPQVFLKECKHIEKEKKGF